MVSADLAGSAPSRGLRNRPPRVASRDVRRPKADATRILLDQTFERTGLTALRLAVAAQAAAVTDEQTAEVVMLIAHELSSNCVRHGGGTGRLRLWVAAGSLHCELSDNGPGITDPGDAGHHLPTPANSGGRGLWIARKMSDLHISTDASGTTVTAVVALSQA
ncbi:ATP-binding protein [Actinoplanes sp. NPDC049681]|uniref:ATP-binding protein n=1 Tax=Actinoplanes sp. NPDC049681 TaxID=3363905 RepID=UPI003797F09F